MLASIRARLRTGAIAAAPLLLSACGQDEGTGTQRFEALQLYGLLFLVCSAVALFERQRVGVRR